MSETVKTSGGLAARLGESEEASGPDFDSEEWVTAGDFRAQATGWKGLRKATYDAFVERCKLLATACGSGYRILDERPGVPYYPVSVVRRAFNDVVLGFPFQVAERLRQEQAGRPAYPDLPAAWGDLIQAKNNLWAALDRKDAEYAAEAAVVVAARLQRLVEDLGYLKGGK